jgi:acyl-CoA thioesterase-2
MLGIERLGGHLFRRTPRPPFEARIFGGEIAGQAVVAAGRTVPRDRLVHSAHAYFLRPGDPRAPLTYRVLPGRDSRSFSSRRVEAVQHGDVVFELAASFQRPEDGFAHQVPQPRAPDPGELPPALDGVTAEPADHAWLEHLQRTRSVELRFPEPPPRLTVRHGGTAEPRQRAWLRSTDPLPDDPVLQAGALTYVSDLLLLSAALSPHGMAIGDPDLQFASLDHSVWFHTPHRLDDWLLYEQEGTWAGGGRALCRGHMYDQAGTLVATLAQEGLLRRRPQRTSDGTPQVIRSSDRPSDRSSRESP